MTTAATANLSDAGSDAAFFRNRKAMLMYPIIVTPFILLLFGILGGGKGTRYEEDMAEANQPGAQGFNATMPNAKSGNIDDRTVESPGYGKAKTGQVLSSFTNTSKDSVSRGLKAIAVEATTPSAAPETHASSMAYMAPVSAPAKVRTNTAAAVATGGSRKGNKDYYYNAPRSTSYYGNGASDQQVAAQLRNYEAGPQSPPVVANQPAGETIYRPANTDAGKSSTVQVSDNFAATRLSEPTGAENAFYTAPTEGSRRKAERAVLSSGNNSGSKKTIAWMIPVVVHEDQTLKEGQQVKLRLLKEISADGITIPANTILYATCQLSDDRLRLTVHSLQQGGQLIPLDLDVYDTDGSPGINVPGLAQNSQISGQMRSSAIQGVNIPGVGGLANNVINTARMGASTSARNTTIRLRAGYNLFLKAQ